MDRLKGIGEWLNKYGETIYRTTAGDIMEAEWSTTTRKGDKLYVHILSDKMPEYITLPLKEKISKAVLFHTGEKVNRDNIDGGIILYTKDLKPSTDCIITITLKIKNSEVIFNSSSQIYARNGSLGLPENRGCSIFLIHHLFLL